MAKKKMSSCPPVRELPLWACLILPVAPLTLASVMVFKGLPKGEVLAAGPPAKQPVNQKPVEPVQPVQPVPAVVPQPKIEPVVPQPKIEPMVPAPKTAPVFPGSASPKQNGLVAAIPGDVFDFLRKASGEKRFAEVDLQGSKLGKPFRGFLRDGGLLIGFQVGYGRFGNNPTINALRPIYLTAEGDKVGVWRGPVPVKPVNCKAKPGYVVGAITIRSASVIDGFCLHYVKFDKGRLDLDEHYSGEWTGGPGGRQASIGGQGYLFAGFCGHLNGQGEPVSLGLLAVRE